MNTTRRHPRSLVEAFGPHTSRYISPSECTRRADRITAVACTLAAAVLALIVYTWN